MGQTASKRTTMYSVDEEGRVVKHQFPFDANEPLGMMKAKRFLERGFRFDDPRMPKVVATPEVKVVEVVDMERLVGIAGTPLVEDAETDGQVELVTPLAKIELVTPSANTELVETQAETQAMKDDIDITREVVGVVCPECGKIWKNEWGLKSHMRRHKGVK